MAKAPKTASAAPAVEETVAEQEAQTSAEGQEPTQDQPEEPQAAPEAPVDTDQQAPETEVPAATPGKTVTVTVPRGFQLRVDDHTVVPVKPGVQEMLEEHATHWYSVANGVTIYNPEA